MVSTEPRDHLLTLAVKGTASSSGQTVRAFLEDPTSGERHLSAPVTLAPWWQTVAVTATPSGGPLRAGVVEERALPAGEATENWTADDRYLIDAVRVAPAPPTPVTTDRRQLLVDGDPWTMRGYYYSAAPPGTPWGSVLGWSSVPGHCQSDAQLMRVSGVNTLKIWFNESYDADAYRQCMDAFHAAGVMLIWLIHPPGFDNQRDDDVYLESYKEWVSFAVNAVKDHPATLGYLIGNEVADHESGSRDWWDQLDELAGLAKQLDPLHVTTYSMGWNQMHGHAGPVNRELAPNIDMWGRNTYSARQGSDYAGYPEQGFDPFFAEGGLQAMVVRDPTRPIWLSEFGTDRYVCPPETPDVDGLTATCSLSAGAHEDPAAQAEWVAADWADIEAELTADDPDGAVVGGVVFMWADYWWFNVVFNFGTPATHDVGGPGGGWTTGKFLDGHLSVEWFGANHAAGHLSSGPRVTLDTFYKMAELWSDGHPEVQGSELAGATGCTATFSVATDEPVYARVDIGNDGPATKVIVGDQLESDNYLADRAVQGTDLARSHELTVSGLAPGQTYRAYVRAFDEMGHVDGGEPIRFDTPAVPCMPSSGALR